MIVIAGQQVCLPVVYPLLPLMALAFRTMPVTATIITDADVTAAITYIHMTAQCRCAALPYSPQGLLLMDSERK
jgi:hypothetical protein